MKDKKKDEYAPKRCSPISPRDPAIFCISMQLLVDDIDFMTLRAAYQAAKEELFKFSDKNLANSAFANALRSKYVSVHEDFTNIYQFINASLFLTYECMFHGSGFPYDGWTNLEVAHLLRAIYLYGTKDYLEVQRKALPQRNIKQITQKWHKVFNQVFRKVVTSYQAESDPIHPITTTDASTKHIDPVVHQKLSTMARTMTLRRATEISKMQIEPSLLIDSVFDICHDNPMLNTQLVSVMRVINDKCGTISEQLIFDAFIAHKAKNTAWLTLEEFIFQKMIAESLIEGEFKKREIRPIPGFRINPFNEYIPMVIKYDKIPPYPKYGSPKLIEKLIGYHEKVEQTVQEVNDDVVTEHEGIIGLIEECVDHKRGVPYSEKCKKFYQIIHILCPAVIKFLDACNMAPDKDTVYSWLNERQKPLITELKNENDILSIIHTVTDKATEHIEGPISANLAGDGIYLAQKDGGKAKKLLQYYVMQLQPLDKSIPCVCVNIKSIGGKKAATEMHT